jgi:hypothetical protein
VSSRRNLSYPSRRSTPNSRPVNRLQPLCSPFVAPVLCFQQLAASFPKTPGVGVPLRDGRCTEAQKCPSVSPLSATLTHSLSRKSFPCHSYANTRDRGVTPPLKSFSPLATHNSPLTLTPFRINTCKSVSKQRTLTCFRINTYEKHREGEGEHQLYRRAAGFFLAMVRRRSAVLCGRREPCFKGHLREPSPRTLRWLDYRTPAGGGLASAQRNSQPVLAHIGPNNRSGHIARLKPAAKIA